MWVHICVLLPFIRGSQLSGDFIYSIRGSLSDSSVYIKAVYFYPLLSIIPEVQQQRSPHSPLPYIANVTALSLLNEIRSGSRPACLCGKLHRLPYVCLCIVIAQQTLESILQLQEDSKSRGNDCRLHWTQHLPRIHQYQSHMTPPFTPAPLEVGQCGVWWLHHACRPSEMTYPFP